MSKFQQWLIAKDSSGLSIQALACMELGVTTAWLCEDGDIFYLLDTIEMLIDHWHDYYSGDYKLHEFLGMEWEQYKLYVEYLKYT